MVFEDSQSGEELVRTHTGRTRRLYGEPAQTETSFTTRGDQAVAGFIPDSAFSAIREGRDEKPKQLQSGEHLVNIPFKLLYGDRKPFCWLISPHMIVLKVFKGSQVIIEKRAV